MIGIFMNPDTKYLLKVEAPEGEEFESVAKFVRRARKAGVITPNHKLVGFRDKESLPLKELE